MDQKIHPAQTYPLQKDDTLMHSFTDKPSSGSGKKITILLIVIALLGIGTGYFLAKNNGQVGSVNVGSLSNGTGGNGGSSSVTVGKLYGNGDLATFKDTAEGTLQNGGIDGEGQYHLVRPGGDSQNVYLTSSDVDLSQFINHKIKVWGQTQQAQKAGWLMDVGRVQVEQ